MKLMSFFTRPPTAPVARERLQLLLAHERTALGGRSELLEMLRTDILQVIAKHVAVDKDKTLRRLRSTSRSAHHQMRPWRRL